MTDCLITQNNLIEVIHNHVFYPAKIRRQFTQAIEYFDLETTFASVSGDML